MDGDLDLAGGVAAARYAAGAVASLLVVAFAVSRRRLVLPLTASADGLSETLLSFERWVVDSAGRAAVTSVVAAAWTADQVDAGALGSPADAAARGVVRVADFVRPVAGGSLERIFWLLVGVLAAAALGHGLWPSR